MRAYQTIRFTEFPDVADIRREGRASRIGKVRHGRGYITGIARRKVRRSMKRADKARIARMEEFQIAT